MEISKKVIKYLALLIFGASLSLNCLLFVESRVFKMEANLIKQEYKSKLEAQKFRATKDLNDLTIACNQDYQVLKMRCSQEINRLHKLYKSNI